MFGNLINNLNINCDCTGATLAKINNVAEQCSVEIIKKVQKGDLDIKTDFIMFDTKDKTVLCVSGQLKEYVKSDEQTNILETFHDKLAHLFDYLADQCIETKKEQVYLTKWARDKCYIHLIPIMSNGKMVSGIISKTYFFGDF